ncbi:hypothetical protein Pst134EA_032802 [Puccinia striiformis f. sp. tritici]|uniref:uncharacterized protein n=1 Tax=Puccinia striiformis f. sp. tritici TaxID=168172 RepID=UPI0020086005|nr:uncharacterized protein Pst134EA_032802 [Puccinia striiformis f. sp. tritici]KAH9443528.1 hypothetical protein Pst134EA_032802 [Puccinia striiformis f. sp. tritici]
MSIIKLRTIDPKQHNRPRTSARKAHTNALDQPQLIDEMDCQMWTKNPPAPPNPQRDHHPIPPTDSLSRAGQPAHMDSSGNPIPSGKSSFVRPALPDYSAQVSDHGSQAGTRKANSSTSSQQPSGGGLSLHDRIKSELEHRDNEQKNRGAQTRGKERRKIEDNMIAKARADFEQAKAREQARAKQSREQTVPEAQPSVDQQSYASERTDVESKPTAEKRAARRSTLHD